MPLSPAVLRDAPGLVLVFVGGMIGTAIRLHLEQAFPAASGQWPMTTFLVNFSGALVLAALLEFLASSSRLPEEASRRLRLFGGTGICGGFTTYSTFAGEQVNLIRDGHFPIALGYGAATLVVGAIGTVVGLAIGARLASRRSLGEPTVVDPDTSDPEVTR